MEPLPAADETPGTKASLAMPIKEAAPTCAARPLNPVDGTAPNRGRKRLASRTPIRGAVGVALSARLDRRPAPAAAPAGAVIDKTPLSPGLDRGCHQLVRCLEHGAQLVVGDFRNRPPRRDAGFPERLRLPEVADARDEPLVEQGITDRALRIAAEVGDHGVQIGRLREDVRPEPADGAVVQLQHRAVPEHGLPLGAAEDKPGTAGELRAS